MSAQNALPKIAITMGDPAGIGLELVLRALNKSTLLEKCTPIILGDIGLANRLRRDLGLGIQYESVDCADNAAHGVVNFITLSNINLDSFHFGESRTDLGLVSTFYIVKAAEMIAAGRIQGVVTSPVNRSMLFQAGFNYSGHTALFKEYSNTQFALAMSMTSHLKFTRVTSHIPLSQVSQSLSLESIERAIRLTDHALKRDFAIDAPKIAVCGVNPHAGEAGLFGKEEMEIVTPAIEAAKKAGIHADGVFSAEALFPQVKRGAYDAIVCMYHDQGHIAQKLLDDDETATTITLGLPVARTSPDIHPNYELAGKGVFKERPMVRAIERAAAIIENRRRFDEKAEAKKS